MHVVQALQPGALGVEGLGHVGGWGPVRGMGPGSREKQLVRTQVGSLRLRGGLDSYLAQLALGGAIHRGQGLTQI